MENEVNNRQKEDQEQVTKVKTEILGQEFVIKGQAEPEYIFKLSNFVDDEIKQAQETDSRMPRNKVLILAAINIADKLFAARREISRLRAEADRLREEVEKRGTGDGGD